MNFKNLLPIPKGETVSQWQEKWLGEVSRDAYEPITLDDLDAYRNRNERLSSYMMRLTTLMAAHRSNMDSMRIKFEASNPRPTEKGITAWKEAEKAYLRDAESNYKFLEDLHSDIATKLSQGQTALRTKCDEVKRL